jgi:hypothetical protein
MGSSSVIAACNPRMRSPHHNCCCCSFKVRKETISFLRFPMTSYLDVTLNSNSRHLKVDGCSGDTECWVLRRLLGSYRQGHWNRGKGLSLAPLACPSHSLSAPFLDYKMGHYEDWMMLNSPSTKFSTGHDSYFLLLFFDIIRVVVAYCPLAFCEETWPSVMVKKKKSHNQPVEMHTNK